MQQALDTLAAVPTLAPAQPQIGFGVVRHARLAPVRNAFAYPTYFLMLPMRSLQTAGSGALAVNRPAALSFYDCDHGDGRGPQTGGALGWLQELLNSHGITHWRAPPTTAATPPMAKSGCTATRVCWATPSSRSVFGIATVRMAACAPSWWR